MIRRLATTDYFDKLFDTGRHVVILCLTDTLTETAAAPYRRVSELVKDHTFWVCPIRTVEDVETVQACRFPQYRWFRDGHEVRQHVGILDDDHLLACFDELKDR